MMEKVILPEQRPRRTEEQIRQEQPWATLGKPDSRKPNVVTSLELDSSIMEQNNIRFQKKYQTIEEKSRSSSLSVSEFSRRAMLGKRIIAVDGMKELAAELRRIGTNLNQLTRLAHENRVTVLDLSAIKKGVGDVWQSLNSLTQKAQ
jgi:hypothetical protein